MPDERWIKTYEETCNSYHRIDDFRGKLLALLPTISGAGAFFLLHDSANSNFNPKHVTAAAIFGMLVSLGLYFYELRGIQRCIKLIKVAQDLEGSSGISVEGQFTQWPPSLGDFINEPIAAAIIYPVVLAGWAYLAAMPYSSMLGAIAAVIVFLVGFWGGWKFYLHVRE